LLPPLLLPLLLQILGDVHLVQTINIMIVFLISGLVLRTQDIKKALSYWPGIAWGFLSILVLTPCLGFALRELPLTPPEFAVGGCAPAGAPAG
jgi:sodium/bile acid cotransporter 7